MRETTFARLTDKTLRAWGMNEHGQTGNGTTVHALSPVNCGGLTDVIGITPYGGSMFAALGDGSFRSWGWNVFGQLAIGRVSEHEVSPQTVVVPAGMKLTGLGSAGPGTGTPFLFAEKDSAPAGAIDLARRAEVTASSAYLILVPANAVDGNSVTRWASDSTLANPDTQWLQLDLGGRREFGRVVLNWEIASAKSYTLDVSTDGSSWTTVASTTTGVGGVENLTFAPVFARYVRLNFTQRNTGAGYSLWGVEVYSS